jgi:hypothetical protein
MGAGKGDKPRPIDKKVYDSNFDNINWNKLEYREDREIKTKKGKLIIVYK